MSTSTSTQPPASTPSIAATIRSDSSVQSRNPFAIVSDLKAGEYCRAIKSVRERIERAEAQRAMATFMPPADKD